MGVEELQQGIIMAIILAFKMGPILNGEGGWRIIVDTNQEEKDVCMHWPEKQIISGMKGER